MVEATKLALAPEYRDDENTNEPQQEPFIITTEHDPNFNEPHGWGV